MRIDGGKLVSFHAVRAVGSGEACGQESNHYREDHNRRNGDGREHQRAPAVAVRRPVGGHVEWKRDPVNANPLGESLDAYAAAVDVSRLVYFSREVGETFADENLTWLSEATETRGEVERSATVTLAHHDCFAGVETDSHSKRKRIV